MGEGGEGEGRCDGEGGGVGGWVLVDCVSEGEGGCDG